MGAFETIEARLQLSADGFNAAIGNAVNSLGTLQNKAGGAHKAMGALGVGLAAVAAGGIAKSVGASMDLQSALTESQAIMGDLTQGEMKAMETAAREVGKTTTFSAEEAGEAFYFLASAGMDAEQSVASMGDVAQFAQAGAFDLATATDLATDAQSALGMSSDDAAENAQNLNRVMDVLVKSNTLANASVQEFSESLTNKAAAAMRQVGMEVEEGASALAVFADQGLKGNRAGTILARTIEGLQSAAQENAGAFEQLGIAVYDADGNMRPMADIVEDMDTAMADMSQEQKNAAMAQLGLNERAAQGINLLSGNTDQMREYEGELQNAGGTAEEVANNQLKSLSAQWDILKSQITDIGIGIGNHLLPALTGLVSMLSDAVSVFVRVNDATDGWLATLSLVGTLVGGLAMAAGSASAVLGAGGFAMAATAASGALSGLAVAAGYVIAPFTAIGSALIGLPSLVMGLTTALNTALLGALSSVGSALLGLPALLYSTATALGSAFVAAASSAVTALMGLPALIYSTATAYATAFVGAVTSAVASLLAFPGAAAAAISAKIAATLQAGILTTAYTGLRTAAMAAAAGTKVLTVSLLTLAAPIAALTIAAVALYTAWKTNFLGIRDITSGVVTGIKALISGDFQTVSDLIGGVAARAKQLWTTHIVPLLETARSILGRIRSEVIAPFLAWFTPIWNKHLATVAAEFRKTAQAWINTISWFVEWARPYVSAFLDAMTAWWGEHGDETMAIVRPLLNGLKRLFEGAFSIITNILVAFVRLARGDFEGMKQSLLQIVRTMVHGIVDLSRWLYNTLVGYSIFPDMASDILGVFTSLKSDSIRIMRDMMDDIVQTIKNKFSDIKRAGKKMATMLADGIKSAAGKPVKAAKNMAGGIRDKFTSSDAKEGPLSDWSTVGPTLGDMLADGIESKASRVGSAAESVAAAARKPFDDLSIYDAISEKHGETSPDAIREMLGRLGHSQRQELADAVASTKWMDKDYQAMAAMRKMTEGGISQGLYDALISKGAGATKLRELLKEGKRSDGPMVRAEDGSMVPKSFYSGGSTGQSEQQVHLKLTVDEEGLLQLIPEDGTERDALTITSGNYGTM